MKKLSERTRNSKFLQVLIGCVVANMSASQYIWSVFSKQYIIEYGWTASQATLPYTLNVVMSGTFVLVAATLSDILAPRFVLLMGTICCSLGWYICGASAVPWMIVIGFGLLCGMSCSLLPNSTTPTAVKWAPANRKGIAAGISHCANGFSSIYMAPLATALMTLGMQSAFKTFALICLCLGLFGFVNLLTPTPEIIAEGQQAVSKNGKVVGDAFVLPEISLRKAIKTPTFWIWWLVNCCSLIGGSMVFSQCAMIAKVQGNWDAGFILVCILALGNGLGRLFWTNMIDKLGVYKTYTLLLSVAAVNMLLFGFYRNIPLLVVGAFISGLCYGGPNAMLYTVGAKEFGSKHLGSIMGGLNTSFAVNGAIGATLIAAMYDINGTYTPAYIFGAICMVVAIILVQMGKKLYEKRVAQAMAAAK